MNLAQSTIVRSIPDHLGSLAGDTNNLSPMVQPGVTMLALGFAVRYQVLQTSPSSSIVIGINFLSSSAIILPNQSEDLPFLRTLENHVVLTRILLHYILRPRGPRPRFIRTPLCQSQPHSGNNLRASRGTRKRISPTTRSCADDSTSNPPFSSCPATQSRQSHPMLRRHPRYGADFESRTNTTVRR